MRTEILYAFILLLYFALLYSFTQMIDTLEFFLLYYCHFVYIFV